jgi:hypothetical protein
VLVPEIPDIKTVKTNKKNPSNWITMLLLQQLQDCKIVVRNAILKLNYHFCFIIYKLEKTDGRRNFLGGQKD